MSNDNYREVTELPPDGVDVQESWAIKAFSADDVTSMIKEARERFKEEAHKDWAGNPDNECTVCHAKDVLLEQHWNDVGGPDTVQCEMCWVDSIIWFWMNEQVAEDRHMTPTEKAAKEIARQVAENHDNG